MRAFLGYLTKKIALSFLALLILFSGVWASLAIFFAWTGSAGMVKAASAAFAALTLITLIFLALPRLRWRTLIVYCLAFGGVLLWWNTLTPSNNRDWHSDVAVLPSAKINNNLVHVRNVRNFRYRSEFDYTPGYYDQTYDLDKLDGVDLVSVYWMGPQIAHILLSFSFSDGKKLAISIEARKEKGEAYSTVRGFFRQYELYYVVADEEDVIKLRTNYRKDPPEDVYIYRLKGPLENARRLFLEYMRQINELNAKPAFYNALTTNCTTTIWLNTHVNPDHLPFSFALLATGYLPQHVYSLGRLEDKGLSFADLQQDAHANPRAATENAATQNFSQLIRGEAQHISKTKTAK